jgi:hypothetical protein
MKGDSFMLSNRYVRKCTRVVCFALAFLVLIVAMFGFSPRASAAPASYGGPSLRLPWLYGNYNISGLTYNCPDHTGKDQFAIDFGLPSGTQVTAAFSGTVHYGSYDGSGYGNNLWVTSSGGYRAVYAHLSSFKVSDGQSVSQGQVIALSGSTGNSTGPHLHFSVRYGGTGSYDGTAQVPEPMSGYTGFGNQTNCVPNHNSWYNPSPGGWWIGPTPSDLTGHSSGSQVQVNFRMNDNNNGGLNHGDITYWSSSSNSWQKASGVKTTFNSDGTADVYVVLTMPNAIFEVSVNVYSNNGSYQLAPSGLRHYCLPSQLGSNNLCPNSLFPSGGSSNGGSGSGGLNASVFEDFSNGIGSWWTNGNVVSTTDGPNIYMRFTPAAQSSAEASKNVGVPALSAYNTIMVQINLHGVTLLGNDASALYLDQGGSWKYVSLSNYVQQGLDGWQTATVPLSDFQGFDQTASFDHLGFRFWVPSASTIDVGTILFSLNGTPPPSGTELLTSPWHLTGNNGDAQGDQSVNANALIGFDTVKVTFDLHGPSFGNGDDEASIVFIQDNDWRAANVIPYGQNGLNGPQTVIIPLSAFHKVGNASIILDLTRSIQGMHCRFWNAGAFTVDVTSIFVYKK